VKFSDDSGSAVIEFLGFGVLLQLPILMFTLQLVALQHDQLAAEAIVRQLARSFVIEGKDPLVATSEVATNFGVTSNKLQVHVVCDPTDCSQDGAVINIQAQVGQASASAVTLK
jgi:hypothetical protein